MRRLCGTVESGCLDVERLSSLPLLIGQVTYVTCAYPTHKGVHGNNRIIDHKMIHCLQEKEEDVLSLWHCFLSCNCSHGGTTHRCKPRRRKRLPCLKFQWGQDPRNGAIRLFHWRDCSLNGWFHEICIARAAELIFLPSLLRTNRNFGASLNKSGAS